MKIAKEGTMQYTSYPTKETAPQRMTRKRMRQTVFVANKKMAKATRKAARLERKSLTNES
jgi:hypothetical protein